MRPTLYRLPYHRPVHLHDSPMLGPKGLIIMEHGKPNLARRAKFVFCCLVFRKHVVASRVGEHSWRKICFGASWDRMIR